MTCAPEWIERCSLCVTVSFSRDVGSSMSMANRVVVIRFLEFNEILFPSVGLIVVLSKISVLHDSNRGY